MENTHEIVGRKMKEYLKDLKEAYAYSMEKKYDILVCNGDLYLLSYAKYLIEYLEVRYG